VWATLLQKAANTTLALAMGKRGQSENKHGKVLSMPARPLDVACTFISVVSNYQVSEHQVSTTPEHLMSSTLDVEVKLALKIQH
jgi:hypothetical protein